MKEEGGARQQEKHCGGWWIYDHEAIEECLDGRKKILKTQGISPSNQNYSVVCLISVILIERRTPCGIKYLMR